MKKYKSPYQIIKSKWVTEKASVLQGLAASESNKSLKRCKKMQYVFEVDVSANKHEIKQALQQIYADKKILVQAVNTICVKPKVYARRGNKRNAGKDVLRKKAIVTLAEGHSLES